MEHRTKYTQHERLPTKQFEDRRVPSTGGSGLSCLGISAKKRPLACVALCLGTEPKPPLAQGPLWKRNWPIDFVYISELSPVMDHPIAGSTVSGALETGDFGRLCIHSHALHYSIGCTDIPLASSQWYKSPAEASREC